MIYSSPPAVSEVVHECFRNNVLTYHAGTGIAHSEQNENANQWVHFLQIWVKPWARGLPPTYHTSSFTEEQKKAGFVTIISPLKAGRNASAEVVKEAVSIAVV